MKDRQYNSFEIKLLGPGLESARVPYTVSLVSCFLSGSAQSIFSQEGKCWLRYPFETTPSMLTQSLQKSWLVEGLWHLGQ